MKKEFNNTILVAPLDWGLGHATRCIPLIKYLLFKQCNIIIAASGMQEKLLKIEFPNLTFIALQPYNVQYPSIKRLFSLKIALQIPKILKIIRFEHNWLKKTAEVYNIDAIISDNRYGLWHKTKPSVFITHQLQISAPFKGLEKWIRFINYRLIREFSVCWVPDDMNVPNLAGKLSHPKRLPKIPVKYLGGISRFELEEGKEFKFYALIVISGPEPQRTLLEKKIIKGLQGINKSVLLVRGLPGSAEVLPAMQNVIVVNHLPAQQLEEAFGASEFIISRSGYTTVMDIIALSKKSILIPTPSQTEQEYLADHLQEQGWCLSIRQDEFELKTALQQALNYKYVFPDLNMQSYKSVLDDFLEDLRSNQALG